MRNNQHPVAVACKTYRKVNKKLAKAIGAPISHSQYPSDDFQDLLDDVNEKSKARAIKWYERGVKRGLAFAVDQLLDGTISVQKGQVTSPRKLVMKVRLRFRDERWQKRKFKLVAAELGFTCH